MGRASALLAVAGALVVWYEVAPHLSGWSLWTSILVVSLVLMPATFLLVWLALPLWRLSWRALAAAAAVLIAATAALEAVDAAVLANLAKLAGLTLVGWAFLTAFENERWVVLVACVIPWVDIFSVAKGPTKEITAHHEDVFGALSIAFVVPDGAARLGLPDVLFFAVFLGASARFALRPVATWLGLATGLALTMICATWWDLNGLPALPGIALGFLLPNADLLWRRLRGSAPRVAVD